MSSDMFSPLPFEENDIDPNEIINRLDSASTVSDELTGRLLDTIGNQLTNVSNVEAELTTRVLTPAAEVLQRANDTQNQLFTQLGNVVGARLGGAGELADSLSRQVPVAFDGPPVLTEETLQALLEDQAEDGDIAIGGIEPEMPPEAIAVGGIEPDPGPTEDEIAVGGIEPEEEPAQDIPPTIVVPPPTTIPGPQQEEEEPPQPQPQPPQPQPQPQPRPQPIVIVPPPSPQCPVPPTIVQCPTPEPEPPPPVIVPAEEQDTPDPFTGAGAIAQTKDFTQCKVDAFTEENASNVAGFQFIDPNRILAHITYGEKTVEEVIETAQSMQRKNLLRPFRWLYWRLSEVNARWIQWFDKQWATMTKSACQFNPIVGFYLGMQVLFNLLSFVTGDTVRKWLVPIRYRTDRLCPQQFPDENEAVEAYVRGTIDRKTMNDWIQANDHCLEPFEKLVFGRIDRVEPLMALQMWRRGFITKQQFDTQIRKNGYTDEELQKAFEDLGDFIPPITDLVRFMVRDVEDTGIVSRFGLDDNFTDKWAGEAKEWGKQQGISDDVARRYWRAHWRIPSPTQLFEMFHRSRGKPDGDPTKITIDMVRTALEQDDLLPFWVDPLIETTFARMTRREARSAFETGAIDKERLRENFIILGLKDKDADDLVRWATIQRRKTLLNTPEMRLFRDGLITEAEARAFLATIKLERVDEDHIILVASRQGNKRFQTRCISAIRKRFLFGEIAGPEAMAELRKIGIAPKVAEEALKSFECEKTARGKTPSTSQLCTWLEEGTITNDDMLARLINIGWERNDAMRILTNCVRKISEKQAREAKKLADQEQRALEKQQREAQAEARQRERQLQTAARNREKAERAKNNREKILQRTIARFAQLSGLDVPTAGACVRGIERQLASETLLTADERIQTVTVAVEKLKPETCELLQSLSAQLADQLLQFGFLDDAFVLSLQQG